MGNANFACEEKKVVSILSNVLEKRRLKFKKCSSKSIRVVPTSERGSWKEVSSFNCNPRSGHSVVVLDNQVYCFGGSVFRNSSTKTVNTLICYDFEKKNWTRLEARGKEPAPRTCHAMCSDGKSKLYVVGGLSKTGQELFGDIVEFNLKSLVWTQLVVHDETSELRGLFGHSIVKYENDLFIFGGSRGVHYCQELLRYSFTASTVSLVQCAGEKPSPRYKHEAFIEREFLYVMGGGDHVPSEPLLDLYCLNLQKFSWVRVKCQGEVPRARFAFGLCYDPTEKRCLIFGGLDCEMESLDDLNCLDLISKSWSQPQLLNSNGPQKRSFHACFMHLDNFFVFGGANSEHKLNDMWKLNIALAVPSLARLAAQVLNSSPQNSQSLKFRNGTFLPSELESYVYRLKK